MTFLLKQLLNTFTPIAINMNSQDLERMNNHNYHSKSKWSISLTIRQEKYIACAVWIIGILAIATTLIILIK